MYENSSYLSETTKEWPCQTLHTVYCLTSNDSNVVESALGIDCIEFIKLIWPLKIIYFSYKIMLLIYW